MVLWLLAFLSLRRPGNNCKKDIVLQKQAVAAMQEEEEEEEEVMSIHVL